MATKPNQKEEEVKLGSASLDLEEVNRNTVKENFNKTVIQAAEEKLQRVSESHPSVEKQGLVNCLRNERIIVRHVNRENGNITNPKHILYGGMAESAAKYYSVPKLQSGMYVNILTDNEKAFLEDIMGLELNALSIYKKVDNYWENRMVRLTKADNYFDLSDPDQYISYKILLANRDFIAPSLQELTDRPKATYQFVIVKEEDENKISKKALNATMQAYMEFGKIQENKDILIQIIETMEGRPVAATTKLEALQNKVNRLIQSNPSIFVKAAVDELLEIKVLLRKCVENRIVANRNGFYYLTSDGSQLCEKGDDPTLHNAAVFVASPKNQQLLLSLQAKLNELK